MQVHGFAAVGQFSAPDPFINGVPVEGGVGVVKKEKQQVVLFGGQGDLVLPPPDFPGPGVHSYPCQGEGLLGFVKPAQDRFHWRVLSHLGSGFLSMMDNADVLRGTLALYEWTDSEMNRRRLEAIIDVTHSETERFEQGYLVRGVQIEVTLDSHGFAGRGDICLFGEMLSRFLALYTDIYLFNRLIIILQPTGERLEWEEKHNRRIPG